jgi:hypothetical protein
MKARAFAILVQRMTAGASLLEDFPVAHWISLLLPAVLECPPAECPFHAPIG